MHREEEYFPCNNGIIFIQCGCHILSCKQLLIVHLRKPRVLSPLRSCVRNEVDLVPLTCEDAYSIVSCRHVPLTDGTTKSENPHMARPLE